MSNNPMHNSNMPDEPETSQWLRDFVRESNRIENIKDTIGRDIEAHVRLLALKTVHVPDLEMFVRTITRDHVLRDMVGLDVMIGGHLPPKGGPNLRIQLANLLHTLTSRDPFHNHLLYEALHPFTDGNGRSGRALWLWQMLCDPTMLSRVTRAKSMTFLNAFAYQAEMAGHNLFTAKRGLYFHVLDQASK